MYGVIEQGLTAVAADILIKVVFEALGVSHLAQDVPVGAQDALDVVAGAVGIVQIAEGYLQGLILLQIQQVFYSLPWQPA